MANQQARQDNSKFPALIAHSEVSGTAETRQVVADSNGRLTVALTDSTNGEGQIKIVQQGKIDTNNSTSTILTADATFTGTGTDVTDYALILLSVYSNVASATDGLKIDKSHDGSTWYLSDEFTISASTFKTFSFQTDAKYYRIRYTNSGTDQTTFTIQSKLMKTYSKPSSHRIVDSISDQDDAELVKAVLTGENPAGSFVNFQSTAAGNFKTSLEELENTISSNSNSQLNTSLFDAETGKAVNIESLGSLKSIIPTRLVGTAFSNGTKDTNFWTETVTGTGSVAQSGEITLATGTTANSTAKYQTVRRARKVPGKANQFRSIGRNKQTPAVDCIRRIGPYCDTDGFFMQFDGETFGVGTRKNSVDTVVTNGNFNGNLGPTIDFGGGTDFTRLVIEYTSLSAKYFVDGNLIHTISATTTSLTNTQDLKVTIELINENGNTTNNEYEILFATILGLGPIETENQYKYIGTNATTVCKYGAGRLEKIINNDNAGNVAVYDGVSAAGTQIAGLDTTKVLGSIDFSAPFNEGLTIVTTLGAKITVVYE